ncbi:hypothetical protein HK096_003087, partial [Nowakowskiella sp. JEL0078]
NFVCDVWLDRDSSTVLFLSLSTIFVLFLVFAMDSHTFMLDKHSVNNLPHCKSNTYLSLNSSLLDFDSNSSLVISAHLNQNSEFNIFNDMFSSDTSSSSFHSSVSSTSLPSPAISSQYPELTSTDISTRIPHSESLMNLELPPEQSEMCENLIQHWGSMGLGTPQLDTIPTGFSYFPQNQPIEIIPEIPDINRSIHQFHRNGHVVRGHSRSRSMPSFELQRDMTPFMIPQPSPSSLMSQSQGYKSSPLNPLSSVSAIDSAQLVQPNPVTMQVNSMTIPSNTPSLPLLQPNSVSITSNSISIPINALSNLSSSQSIPTSHFSIPNNVSPDLAQRTISLNREGTEMDKIFSSPESINPSLISNTKRHFPSNSIQSSKGVLLLPLPALYKKKESLSGPELFAKLDEELRRIDFDDVTVTELKDMLRQRGLPSTGKKSVLVDRLQKELEFANARNNGNLKFEDDQLVQMNQSKTVAQKPTMSLSLTDRDSPPTTPYSTVSPQSPHKLLPGKRIVMKHTHSRNKSFSDTRMLARMRNDEGVKKSTLDTMSFGKSSIGDVNMTLDEGLIIFFFGFFN